MDDVARLPLIDRSDLFAETARRRGLNAAIIEKDFWVCWTLKRLFTLADPPAGLLFKGGTSLSKVFGIIERFSEDVDLSFDRASLGFGGESDPLNATSGKKRKHRLEALTDTCRRTIQERLLPQLSESFSNALGAQRSENWILELAEDDLDRQTLLFHYPAENSHRRADEPAYIRFAVRMEIGARAEHWPAKLAMIKPYAAEEFPTLSKTPDVRFLFWPPSGLSGRKPLYCTCGITLQLKRNSRIDSQGIITTSCDCSNMTWAKRQSRTSSYC